MLWKRDWGLTLRMWMTGLLLLVVYLVFMAILVTLGVSAIFVVLLAVGMGLVQFFFSDKLVLWSTGARIIEPDEYPELHRSIEKLCAEADLPKPRIAIMQSPVPNAFATGRSPKHAVVACTDSILRMLNRDELEAVLAHELSHVKNRDILTMTVASFVAMIAAIIMQNFLFASLFGGERRTRRRKAFLEALEELQNALGELNDLAITPALLERLGLAGTAAAAALTTETDDRDAMVHRAAKAYGALIAAKPFWQ